MNALLSTWTSRLPRFTALGHTPSIGLYLGHDHLNLVQMTGDAPAQLRAMASIPMGAPLDEVLRDAPKVRRLLKQAFTSEPFRGRKVVSCLPADQVRILSISYAPTEGQGDDAAVASELRERLHDELDQMVVDYLPLRRDEGDGAQREALVALAPRAQVLTYLHLLTDAGLQVDALDIGPAALMRVVKHTGARHFPDFPSMPNALLINFGSAQSYLTVVWGRRTVLDRAIEFGDARLVGRLTSVLGMLPEQALRMLRQEGTAAALMENGGGVVEEVLRPELKLLQQEISKTLVYMASRTRGRSVDTVFLAGPVARYAVVVASLRQQVQVPVHTLNPALDFGTAATRRYEESLGTESGMALAAGLALRGEPYNE